MAGPEGVHRDNGHDASDVDARTPAHPPPPPPPSDSNSAGEDGSDDATISQLITDFNKHEITSATPQVLSSALQHEEVEQPHDSSSTPRSGSSDDGDAAAAAAGGGEGLKASIYNFVADLGHQITSAIHPKKEAPNEPPEITSRGVSESDLFELKAQRNPKNSFSATNDARGK